MGLRSKLESNLPDWMIVGQRSKLILLRGEHLSYHLSEALVKLGTAAASFGQDEPAFIDIVYESLPFRGCENGHFVSVDKENRRSQQVAGFRRLGVDDLPGQQALPVAGNAADNVSHIVRVVVPVAHRVMA